MAFKIYIEPFLDTDSELISPIILSVTFYYSQQEALRIPELTKAGLERVRRSRKGLGRQTCSSGGRPCWRR